VPVRQDGTIEAAYRTGIETAHVDGLVNIDVPDGHATSLARSLDEQLTPIEHVDRSGMTKYTSRPADLGLPPDVGGNNGYVIAAEDAPLWQVAAAGDLLAEAEKGFHDGGMQTRRARFDHEIGESQVWSHTLLGATTASIIEEWAQPVPADAPTAIFLVSEADGLDDCLDFWNRRAHQGAGDDHRARRADRTADQARRNHPRPARQHLRHRPRNPQGAGELDEPVEASGLSMSPSR
jgi:hypothetical protein